MAQHAACFIGCAAKLLEEKEGTDSRGILDRLLFGESEAPEDMSLEDIISQIEGIIPIEDDSFGSIPWSQILGIILPLLIELLKR